MTPHEACEIWLLCGILIGAVMATASNVLILRADRANQCEEQLDCRGFADLDQTLEAKEK